MSAKRLRYAASFLGQLFINFLKLIFQASLKFLIFRRLAFKRLEHMGSNFILGRSLIRFIEETLSIVVFLVIDRALRRESFYNLIIFIFFASLVIVKM